MDNGIINQVGDIQNKHDTFGKDSAIYWSGTTVQKGKFHPPTGLYRLVEPLSNKGIVTDQPSSVIENDETDLFAVNSAELRKITE